MQCPQSLSLTPPTCGRRGSTCYGQLSCRHVAWIDAVVDWMGYHLARTNPSAFSYQKSGFQPERPTPKCRLGMRLATSLLVCVSYLPTEQDCHTQPLYAHTTEMVLWYGKEKQGVDEGRDDAMKRWCWVRELEKVLGDWASKGVMIFDNGHHHPTFKCSNSMIFPLHFLW